MRAWNSLQNRLLFYFVLLMILPLTVSGIMAYQRARSSLVKVEHAHLDMLLESKMEESRRMIQVFSGQDIDPATLVSMLKPFVERIRVEPNGFALLVRGDGTVLVAPPGQRLPPRLDLPQGNLQQGGSSRYMWGEQRFYTVVRAYPSNNLLLLVANRESDFMHEVESLKWMMLFTGLIALLAAVAAALFLARSISRPVTELASAAQEIARGDLRHPVPLTGGVSEVRVLAESLSEMHQQLREMILRVKDNAGGVSQLAAGMEEDSRQAAKAAREQTDEVERVVVAVSQARAASAQSCQSSLRTAEMARSSAEAAQRGHDSVTDTIRGIERIDQVVTGGAEIIRKLGQSSAEIGEVIMVIDEIADQTNLLALNAAIEAARADEHGRGFAVVADEVRKLAERTSLATREISRTIKSIQDDARRAVASMEQGTAEVSQGRELADRAGISLREILSVSHQMLNVMMENNKAATDQAQAAEEISEKIQRISAAIGETDRRIAGVAGAAEQLGGETELLNEMVAQFQLEGSGPAAGMLPRSREVSPSMDRAA